MEGPEVEPSSVRTSELLFLIRSDVPSEGRLRRKHLEKEIGELSPDWLQNSFPDQGEVRY